jgi:hypothetical protein
METAECPDGQTWCRDCEECHLLLLMAANPPKIDECGQPER